MHDHHVARISAGRADIETKPPSSLCGRTSKDTTDRYKIDFRTRIVLFAYCYDSSSLSVVDDDEDKDPPPLSAVTRALKSPSVPAVLCVASFSMSSFSDASAASAGATSVGHMASVAVVVVSKEEEEKNVSSSSSSSFSSPKCVR